MTPVMCLIRMCGAQHIMERSEHSWREEMSSFYNQAILLCDKIKYLAGLTLAPTFLF